MYLNLINYIFIKIIFLKSQPPKLCKKNQGLGGPANVFGSVKRSLDMCSQQDLCPRLALVDNFLNTNCCFLWTYLRLMHVSNMEHFSLPPTGPL
jgi:hypothetical protein